MKGTNHYMNITERMLLEEAMEDRGVSSPKSAIRLAYLRTLVEEGTLPITLQTPVKTAITPFKNNMRERARGKKKRVK